MRILKLLGLLISLFTSSALAEAYQLDLILVAPGARGEMRDVVMNEAVHGESSSLSFIASYYKDFPDANSKIAQDAKKAREEYEKALSETGILPQPALTPSEQSRKDKAGQAIVDRTKASIDMRREQAFNITARQENENKRLKAIQYYLSVSNTEVSRV